MRAELRIGVFVDLIYRDDRGSISTDLSFILFVAALAPRLGEVVLFGRLDPAAGRSPYEVPHHAIRFVALPHYPRVTSVWRLVRAARGARRAFIRELENLDAVLLFGPHPLALEFARIARRRRTPVFLGVRQDFPEYIRGRLPSRARHVAVPLARALEHRFRRLARTSPALVVGDVLYRAYVDSGARVIKTSFSLVRPGDVVTADEALSRPWDDELRVLSVGRLEAEKNPLLLPEILAELRTRYRGWRMVVAGAGPLMEAVAGRASALGVADALLMPGYVPFGEQLWEAYRGCHAFVHVSLTEGVPQVLVEAQAAGLPIVATDVGGVAAALGNGILADVVPPGDPAAAAAAFERLRLDPELRQRRIVAGLQAVGENTLDAEVDRIAAFIRAELQGGEAARAA